MSSFKITSTQGQRFGWNRSGCDNTFKQDMYRLCEKQFSRLISWPTKYERCKFFADLYYKAVRTAGSLYWSNPSEGWCKNVCTEALGDPSKPLDVKMTPKMTNISVNSSHPHVKLEILVEN